MQVDYKPDEWEIYHIDEEGKKQGLLRRMKQAEAQRFFYLVCQCYYVDNKLHGPLTFFQEDGKVHSVRNFEHGLMEGTATVFSATDGSVFIESEYKKDREVTKKIFWPGSKPRLYTYKYVKGKKIETIEE